MNTTWLNTAEECADSEWRPPLPTVNTHVCAGRVLCIYNHSSRGMSVGGVVFMCVFITAVLVTVCV